jgi:hypothetical protein
MRTSPPETGMYVSRAVDVANELPPVRPYHSLSSTAQRLIDIFQDGLSEASRVKVDTAQAIAVIRFIANDMSPIPRQQRSGMLGPEGGETPGPRS